MTDATTTDAAATMPAANDAASKPAKAAKAPKTSKAAAAPKPAKVKAAKPVSARAAIQAAAEAGKLPSPPDFSAETHKRFRGKLAELTALVKAGDIAALRAYAINPISTSPKALDRYRNLAVTALEARAAKAA